MRLVFISFSIFFAALFIQIFVWRFMYTLRNIFVFFIIFIGTFFISLLILFNFNFIEILQILILYFSIFLSYLITFTGIEDVSPSLRIFRIIKNSEEIGITINELYLIFNKYNLINKRTNSLIFNNFITIKENNKFILTSRGLKTAKIYYLISKLLNTKSSV